MTVAILQSSLSMKHKPKLVEQIFADLNKDRPVLSVEDFEEIVKRNEIKKREGKKDKVLLCESQKD